MIVTACHHASEGALLGAPSLTGVLHPTPTEEEIAAGVVASLKDDLMREFQGRIASGMVMHAALLPKWFGKRIVPVRKPGVGLCEDVDDVQITVCVQIASIVVRDGH